MKHQFFLNEKGATILETVLLMSLLALLVLASMGFVGDTNKESFETAGQELEKANNPDGNSLIITSGNGISTKGGGNK